MIPVYREGLRKLVTRNTHLASFSLLLLTIITQKITQIPYRFFQHLNSRKIYDTEVIRLSPVKPRPLDDQKFLICQKIVSKLHVICNIESLYIYLRENVKCRLGLHCRNPRNIRQRLINILSLFINPSSRNGITVHTLVSPQGCLYNRLRRNIGTQSHVRKHIDSFNIVFGNSLISA